MEVVVPCDCGSRFSFDVEPVNGRLPTGAELLCPSCNKDGVPLANRVISENLRKAAQKLQATAATVVAKKSFFSRAAKKAEPVVHDPYRTPDPYQTPARDPFAKARESDEDEIYTGPNKVKGMIGALAGGILGATIWASAVYFTGYEIRYVAVGVGALVGLGSRKIGGGRDYHLGLFATGCALLAILVGQFFAANAYVKQEAVEIARLQYDSRIESAKEAGDLKSDEEFKAFIAAFRSTLLKPIAPASVTPKAVADFKQTELPVLKKLAAGEPTREVFIEQERKAFLAKLTVKDIFIASITPYLFFWVFIGIGAAWKLASDYGTSVE